MLKKASAALLLLMVHTVYGQTPARSAVATIARFPFEYTGLLASGPARVGIKLVEQGRRAVLQGDEMGALDVVIDDVLVAHDVGLAFSANAVSRSIIARPEGPTIIYSHPTFTVREHVYAPLTAAGALIVLEVETVRPLTISLSAPANVFQVDSVSAANQYIAIAFGDSAALLLEHAHQVWQEKVAHYRRVLNDGVVIDAFDQRVVQAYQWAKVAADQPPPLTSEDFAADPLDPVALDSLLRELGAASSTADWGVRWRGQVSPRATANRARQSYDVHRDWAAFDLVQDLTRATFDFTRGRIPSLLSGSYYQVIDTPDRDAVLTARTFVELIEKGLVGWQADAAARAGALEPHMPAEWPDMSIGNLRVGRDRLNATLSRERGVFGINVHRMTAGAPIFLRIAPALPLGAHIDRVVVNDKDVAFQREETAHDVHAVAELQLLADAQIEVHYDGGIDVLTPPEHVDIGEASHELKILDFRREQRDYVVVVEGVAASAYALGLRSGWRVRSVQGSDGFEQSGERVNIRLTMPDGAGFVRKTLRIRVAS